jgi:hypothetical protein
MKKYGGEKIIDPFYTISFYLYILTTLLKGTSGEKNIASLQLTKLKSKFFVKLFDINKNICQYFGEDHVFTNYLKREN